IQFFFDLLSYYEEKFQVTLERVWNLDEASFKIGELKYQAYGIGPVGTLNNVSYESSELVTVLELISATGDLGKLLLIYKGVNLMEAWFLQER
ncbi:hypothetical protein L873DRAFT_1708949, partial [Choiromyces venosus 120613-1]